MQNVGLPIVFLLLVGISFLWFAITLKRKNVSNSTIVKWLIINIVFLALFVYLLIIGIISEVRIEAFDYKKYNFLQLIAIHILGFDNDKAPWAWSFIIIIIFLIMSLSIAISTIIKLNQQKYRINELNRNLAILKGKIAIQMNEFNFDTSELSIEELKYLLEEQLAKEKLKAKYKSKFIRLSKSIDGELHTKTKTLLNIKKEDEDKKKK